MKKWSKVLTIVLCVILLVTASVLGTIALLIKKSGTVTNSFTVGNIYLTLDESALDGNGNIDKTVDPVMKNTYKLLAGETYQKDPTVHVGANSEDCYLFVVVNNGITGVETKAEGKTIKEQIRANGWAELVEGIYWQSYETKTEGKDYLVFSEFTIDSEVDLDTLLECESKTIEITAYAVQRTEEATEAGAAAAWEMACTKLA